MQRLPLVETNGPVMQAERQERKPQPQVAPAQPSSLQFRSFSPFEDNESAEAIIALLSEALAREPVVTYFTKGNLQHAALFWQELIRARFKCSPQARQVYCLSDFSTAAIVHTYPRERATRWGLLKSGRVLKFASTIPLGKWRALNECTQDLERQKQAFLQSRGEFLYLELIATAAKHRANGLGSMLLHHICHLADEQRRWVYVEATSQEARTWYKRNGFQDLMAYTLRPHCPPLLVMARPPRPLPPPALPHQWMQQEEQAAQRQQQWRGGAGLQQQQQEEEEEGVVYRSARTRR